MFNKPLRQNVTREKLCEALWYKEISSKMLMKLNPLVGRCPLVSSLGGPTGFFYSVKNQSFRHKFHKNPKK